MRLIGALLQKYKNLTAPDAALKDIFCSIVKEKVNIHLEPTQVELRGKTLYVKAGSSLKSELGLRGEDILGALYIQTGKKIEGIR